MSGIRPPGVHMCEQRRPRPVPLRLQVAPLIEVDIDKAKEVGRGGRGGPGAGGVGGVGMGFSIP